MTIAAVPMKTRQEILEAILSLSERITGALPSAVIPVSVVRRDQ
jgi:hypothetical protein